MDSICLDERMKGLDFLVVKMQYLANIKWLAMKRNRFVLVFLVLVLVVGAVESQSVDLSPKTLKYEPFVWQSEISAGSTRQTLWNGVSKNTIIEKEK